jgi:hypothetical protein
LRCSAPIFRRSCAYHLRKSGLVLADGRRLKYAVAAPPIEVNKDNVGSRRQELFDQSHSYALAGRPRTGRLLLLSCGGVFDNRTGHYQSNIFVYALPT